MNEFEEIFNSIYAEEHPDNPIPEDTSTPVFPSDSSEAGYGSLPSEQADAYDSYLKAASEEPDDSDDAIFAKYDHHRKPRSYQANEIDYDTVSENDAEYDEADRTRESSYDIDSFSEYDFDDDEYDDDFSSKSFGDFLSSRIAGLALKIRGGVPSDATTATGEEDAEGLGPEIPLMAASKYYGSQVSFLKIRLIISLFFVFILAYISIGLPIVGTMNNVTIATSACLAIQFSIIVFSLDVFTNGILNMFRGRLGADSLAALSCLLTSADGIMVMTGNCEPHLPFCLISSLSLIGILFSSFVSTRGIRKALRVPAISQCCYTVTGETGITGKEITLLKSDRKVEGFLRRIEEEPVDEYVYRKIAPIIIILSLALSVLIALFKKDLKNLVYILTVVFSSSVPISSLLCYALPFFRGSYKIFSNGAAIAGWSGMTDIGHSKNLIVTDRDLFPPDCVEIENVRIFADYDSDKVIAYAGSMIAASGCGLTNAFNILLEENDCEKIRVDNFECLSGGGFQGMIEGRTIICGNTDLMRLMNIRIPARLVDGNSVLLAIDGVLYGIFKIKYKASPKVRRALVSLMNSNRHPIFAIRDFNITPEMIHDCFDVATDGYDFPPYTERFPISEAKPAEDSKIAGVLCREGLGPLTALADTGRTLFVITRINTVISVLSAFVGMIASALFLYLGNSINITLVFIYSIICFAPVLILGLIGTSFN